MKKIISPYMSNLCENVFDFIKKNKNVGYPQIIDSFVDEKHPENIVMQALLILSGKEIVRTNFEPELTFCAKNVKPKFSEIENCTSLSVANFKDHLKGSEVLKGEIKSSDVKVFQLNEETYLNEKEFYDYFWNIILFSQNPNLGKIENSLPKNQFFETFGVLGAKNYVYYAKVKNEIVGFLIASNNPLCFVDGKVLNFENKNVVEISQVIVNRFVRTSGIGTKLLENAVNDLKKNNKIDLFAYLPATKGGKNLMWKVFNDKFDFPICKYVGEYSENDKFNVEYFILPNQSKVIPAFLKPVVDERV